MRNFRSDLSITTEVGDGLVALGKAMGALVSRRADLCDRRVQRRALASERNVAMAEQSRAAVEAGRGTPMTKAWVSQCLGEAIKGRLATVVSELGCPFEQLGLTEHGSWRQEPHSGGLGWGLPCAMGMKLADPDRLVVATMGDGSYLFANPVACHHVAEAHGIPVLTIVLNNAGYGAVRHSVRRPLPDGLRGQGRRHSADRVCRPRPTSPSSPGPAGPTPRPSPTAPSCPPRWPGRCTS